MFNVGICCDDKDKINIIEGYLKKFSKENAFKYKTYKYNSLESLISSHPKNLDILFISVDLNDKNIVSNINDKFNLLYNNIQIVFIAEMVDFILNGFCLKNHKSILTPLKYSSFEEEISNCVKALNDKTINKVFLSQNTDVHSMDIDNICTDSTFSDLLSNIPISSILFIKNRLDKCTIFTCNNSIEVNCTIDDLEIYLDKFLFSRCHNDYLINLNKINKLSKDCVMINSISIPVSVDKFSDLKNKLLVILNIK